jgi:hypothetical protein
MASKLPLDSKEPNAALLQLRFLIEISKLLIEVVKSTYNNQYS